MMTVFGVKTGVNASSKLSKRCSLNAFPIANTPIPLAPPFEFPPTSPFPASSPPLWGLLAVTLVHVGLI